MIIFHSNQIENSKIQVGGKALNLNWLLRHGFQTPQWYVLPAEQLKMVFASSANPARQQLRDELSKIASFLNEGISVRSSAIHEDSKTQSMAGFFKTELNVKGIDHTLSAIESVFKSGADKGNEMSVILQKMISSEKSGVAFSVHVAERNLKKMMISAGWGVGEGIVSGLVDTDEFVFDRTTKSWTEEIRNQKRTLGSEELSCLAKVVDEIHIKYQMPVDIEWAFQSGQLFILQVRPLVGAFENTETILDCSNIQESYNGVVLPLTASLAFKAYHLVYRQLMVVMGFSQAQIESQDVRHQKMLSYFNGRIYYNINSWYLGLLLLPSFGRNKQDMESMMGLAEPVDLIQDQKLTSVEKIFRLPSMVKTLGSLIYKFATLGSRVNSFDREFWHQMSLIDRKQLTFQNLQELTDSIRSVETGCLKEWGVPIINDFYVMMMQGKVKRSLAKLDLETDMPALLFQKNLPSLVPTLVLQEIVSEISKDSKTKNFFLQKDYLIQGLSGLPAAIVQKIENWIELYGDRCIGELKLESVSYRENPTLLFDFIFHGLNTKTTQQGFSIEVEREKALSKLNLKTGFFQRRKVLGDIEKLKRGIFWREQMRLHRTRVFGMMRTLYRQVGIRFEALGILQDKEDIFYLTIPEIFDFVEGRSIHQNFLKTAQVRKEEIAGFYKLKTQQQVWVQGPIAHGKQIKRSSLSSAASENALKGLGCSSGVIKGQIKYVESMADIADIEGKVLLALRTDPGWTPLFTQVIGVIIERGSALSHSVIVARELGLPVIVGIPNITELLKDGDEVEIDGGHGTVRIISQKNDHRKNQSDGPSTTNLSS